MILFVASNKMDISSATQWLRRSSLRIAVVKYRHRGLRPSDCFLASYPKSGNTWLRHLLVHALTGQSTDWRSKLTEYSLGVGSHAHLKPLLRDQGRLIKTHERFQRQYQRSILMVRDPRDVAVSQFHYNRGFMQDSGRRQDFPEFFDRFLQGQVCVYGDWSSHCRSWYDACQQGKALLVKYESMKDDGVSNLRQIASFLEVTIDDETLRNVIADNSAESMKQKEQAYRSTTDRPEKSFVRSAKAGGWRDYFSPEMERRLADVFGETMTLYGYKS
jgi:Sulfotransferase domain